MRHRVHSETPGLSVFLVGLGAAAVLLLVAALLPIGAIVVALLVVMASGFRRLFPHFFTPRARYERRHIRLAGPRPDAWLG